MGQTSPPEQFQLSASLFSAQPIVAEGQESDNWIRGVVVNDGNAPATVRIVLNAENETLYNATHIVLPGPSNRQEVTVGWEGPTLASGLRQIVLRLDAMIQADNEAVYGITETLSRSVQRNVLRLLPDSSHPVQETMQPGESAIIAKVLVENLGSVQDTATLDFAAAAAGWVYEASPPQVSLSPGQSMPIFVTARAPDFAQVGSETVTLQVRTSEERVKDSLRYSLPLQTPVVQLGDHLRFTVSPTSQTISPGDQVALTARVFNPTVQQHSFTVSVTATGSLRDIPLVGSPTGTQSLGPGESLSFSLEGTVPARLTGQPSDAVAGLRSYRLAALNSTSPDESLAETVGLVEVEQHYETGLELAGAVPEEVEPGSMVQIPLRLSNRGNGDDVVCIDADVAEGWSRPDQCVSIGPMRESEQSADLQWRAEIATNSTAGPQSVILRAVSQASGTVVRSEELVLSVAVRERTHPRISPSVGPSKPVPGPATGGVSPVPFSPAFSPCLLPASPEDVVQVPLQLLNAGNINGSFVLAIEAVQAVPASGWIVGVSMSPFVLSRDASEWTTLTVNAPAVLEPLDRVGFDIRLTDEQAPSQSHRISCRVEASFPDLVPAVALPFTNPPEIYAGHAATLNVGIANIGWAPTGRPFKVQSVIEGPGGFSFRETRTVESLDSLRTGGAWWRTVPIVFHPVQPGPHSYVVRVDPENAVDEMGLASNNTLSGQVGVLDFGIQVMAPIGRVAIPEQHVSFAGATAFKVRNQGSGHHILDLAVDLDPPWRPPERKTITLHPGQEHLIELDFKVPREPLTSDILVSIHVANATVPSLAVEGTTRVRIDDNEPPVISSLTAQPLHVLVDQSVRLTAQIHDAAGVSEARLFVVHPEGKVSSHAMKGNGPVGAFEATLKFDALGVYKLHAWARDASVSNNSADNRASPLRIEVLPDDRPSVRLLTPANESSVRPGTPLVFTVLSKRPIVHLEYSLGQGPPVTPPVSNPFQISTEGWSDGVVTFRLLVRDALGVEAKEEFSFDIDGTPPLVSRVSMNPADGPTGSSARVVASITDNTGVASATLWLERAGGQVDEVAMSRGSDGEWVADFIIPEGLKALSVVATDTAGNHAPGELLVPYETPGGSRGRFLPGPSPAFVLLLVFILLGARHRGGAGRTPHV